MHIKQFRYGSDNLAYLVFGEKEAVAVDPGAVNEMRRFLDGCGLQLAYVVNTHTHPDHTVGNRQIMAKTGAAYLDIGQLIKEKHFILEGRRIDVYHTPGHTEDSILFHFNGILITGDTLFTGKVGKCFTGDYEKLLSSVKQIMSFPDDTLIYGGHDYVEEYMATAGSIEPDNNAIDGFLKNRSPDHVVSTLADEYRINPTLRFNTPALVDIMKKKGLDVSTEYARWLSIISLV